jgi:hypothetical protein
MKTTKFELATLDNLQVVDAAIDASLLRTGELLTAERYQQELDWAAEGESERQDELAYERYLESRCDAEYAIIERDAPWAL